MIIKREKNLELIEEFLKNNFSSPTHWPDWNLIVSKFFFTEFFYFTAYEGNDLIGICPVHKSKNGILQNLYSGQFNFIPNGGWIFKRSFKFNFNTFPLKYNESILIFSLPHLIDFNVTYYSNKNLDTRLTLVINLDNSLDYIWKNNIDSKRRNKIRKAEKNNIEIELVDVKKMNFKDFYNLYENANKKYNLKSLPEKFFLELINKSKNIGIEIILAKKDNHLLNGVAIIYDKNYSYYWLGFSDDKVPNLGQGELLQWEAIKRMKEFGCKYYDLCYIEKERLPHIYEFKKGFSKDEIPIFILSKRHIWYRILNRIIKLF